jgi:hypothetical protein
MLRTHQLIAQDGGSPLKMKKIKMKDLYFWLCNLGISTIKRGCSLEGSGEKILAQNHIVPTSLPINKMERETEMWGFV